METTLIIVKPDGVARRLVGRIIARFEDKGLQIAAMKLMVIDKALAGKHYAEHEGKPFFPSLIQFITSGPVVVMVVRGLNAISVCRKMMGATFGANAEAGTLRGDFALSRAFNLVHGSDGPEAAEKELGLYFTPKEILDNPQADLEWIYDTASGNPE